MIFSENSILKIKEIINKGVGNAAEIFQSMLDEEVYLTVPSIVIQASEFVPNKNPILDLAVVSLDFDGILNGSVQLLFTSDSSEKLVQTFNKDLEITEDEIIELRVETLSEIGNIVLNSLMGTISNSFNINLTFTPPVYNENSQIFINDNKNLYSNKLIAQTNFLIKDIKVIVEIILYLDVNSIQKIKSYL